MTFYEWAMTKRITDTPRGDFLQDLRWDEYAADVPNTKDAWENHLRLWRADERARVAFRLLWVSYERYLANNPELTLSTRSTVTAQTVAMDFA